MKGLLLYDRTGAARNEWYIEEYKRIGKLMGVNLELALVEESTFGITDSKLFLAPIARPDFVICRTIFPLVSLHLEKMGIPVFNSALVSDVCNDKRKTHMFFAGVPMLRTMFADKRFLKESLPPFPFVLKSACGHGGTEVFMINNKSELDSALNAIYGDAVLLQEVADFGRDLRVYIINDEIVMSVMRTSDSDFRSNFSLGGKPALHTLSEDERAIVRACTEKMHFDMAGIDLLYKNGKPCLNEIEDVVGTRMIYEVSDIDVVSMHLQHIIKTLNADSAF